MKIIKLAVLAIVLLCTSGIAFADCAGNSCSDVYVDKLYVTTNSNAAIYIGTSSDETLLNCEPQGDVYLTLDSSSSNADKVYSSLLAAQLANKKVRLRVYSGTTGCKILYMTLDRQ